MYCARKAEREARRRDVHSVQEATNLRDEMLDWGGYVLYMSGLPLPPLKGEGEIFCARGVENVKRFGLGGSFAFLGGRVMFSWGVQSGRLRGFHANFFVI